jgi:hypothetical protein
MEITTLKTGLAEGILVKHAMSRLDVMKYVDTDDLLWHHSEELTRLEYSLSVREGHRTRTASSSSIFGVRPSIR